MLPARRTSWCSCCATFQDPMGYVFRCNHVSLLPALRRAQFQDPTGYVFRCNINWGEDYDIAGVLFQDPTGYVFRCNLPFLVFVQIFHKDFKTLRVMSFVVILFVVHFHPLTACYFKTLRVMSFVVITMSVSSCTRSAIFQDPTGYVFRCNTTHVPRSRTCTPNFKTLRVMSFVVIRGGGGER